MDLKLLMDCIKNPTKSQILLCLQEHQNLTAKELMNATSNIPQATLYRALKKMEEDNIIVVVDTAQRRGVLEKTYALNSSVNDLEGEISASNDGAAYLKLFTNFITEILSEFDEYSKKDNIDLANDGSGFSAMPIYATNEELMMYGQQIEKILEPALIKRSEKQRLRTFATIITPPRKDVL